MADGFMKRPIPSQMDCWQCNEEGSITPTSYYCPECKAPACDGHVEGGVCFDCLIFELDNAKEKD